MAKSAATLIGLLRNVTGRTDSTDPLFTDEVMLGYLNDFLNLQSSQDIRIFKNMTWLEFDISPTTPNPMPIDLQALGLTTIGAPAYVQQIRANLPVQVTNAPMSGTIDGANQEFFLAGTPEIVPGTVFVSGTNPAQSLADDSLGGLVGDGSGSVNYLNGMINVVLNTAPVVASEVTVSYQYIPVPTPQSLNPNFSLELWWFQDPQDFYRHWPDRLNYTPQRPTSVLYYNNELTFRGPPDRPYHIKIQAYHTEVEIDASGNISQDYLYRYAVYGAALDLFSDYGEMDKWHEYYPAFTRYRALVYSRTVSQYQGQRPNPEF